jgi:leucyl aminopeptidase
MGLNLLLAVGRGSSYSSRLIILEYDNNKSSGEHIVLIGKGITFDTGGLNLKLSTHILDMKCDMAGAATVLGMLKTASELKIKKNIAAIIPTCENMIGPNAYKPGDIIKSYSGKTVEVIDTDAEGRLVLADAITYAVKHLKPTYILDFATLTGSIIRTFGGFVTGLFSNNDLLAEKIFHAGEMTYERVWRLPVYDEYKELMKGEFSDLKNISKEEYAGAITGAAFLEEFVEKIPWAHFDIGGSAFFDKQKFYIPKGGTGIGIRLFVELLRRL